MSRAMMLVLTAALAAKPPRPGDWSFGWLAVASIAAVSLAIVVCLWAFTTYFSAHRQRETNSPWRLFADLCSAHKLSRRERQMLKRLANQHRLDQPAMLFVEPSMYRVEKLGPNWADQFDELQSLQKRLFASR